MRSPIAPWTVGFIGAAVAVLAALVYLVFVIADVTGGGSNDVPLPGGGGDSGEPSPTPGEENGDTPGGEEVLFEGEVPESLNLPNMRQAADDESADLRFARTGGDDGLATGYYVPVVAQWTAIDELTSDQLAAALSGGATNWSELGGLDGPINVYAVEDSAGLEIAGEFAGGVTPDQTFQDYEELVGALEPDSGAVALIPLEELHVSVSAVTVDGVDLARGYGDPAGWPLVERVSVEPLTDRGEEALAMLDANGPEAPEVTSVVLTGDILPVRCSLQRIEQSGDWASPFRGEMADYIGSADLAIGSWDAGVHDIYDHHRCHEHVNLSTPPEALEMIHHAGFDGVTIASNHVFDCGTGGLWCEETFLATLDHFEEAGIPTVGGGRNLEEAFEPLIFERNGLTFGFLGYDDIQAMHLGATEDEPGTAPMDDDYSAELAEGYSSMAFDAPVETLGTDRITERVAALKEEVDFVITLPQSGTEDTHDAALRSVKAHRAVADVGADVVAANQAHHVQAAEAWDDTFIAYALGNFVYDQRHTPEHYQCYLVEASFWEDRLAAVKLIPCQIEDMHRPLFVDDQTRLKILNDVYSAAARIPAEVP